MSYLLVEIGISESADHGSSFSDVIFGGDHSSVSSSRVGVDCSSCALLSSACSISPIKQFSAAPEFILLLGDAHDGASDVFIL